jgi:hypothetical protein
MSQKNVATFTFTPPEPAIVIQLLYGIPKEFDSTDIIPPLTEEEKVFAWVGILGFAQMDPSAQGPIDGFLLRLLTEDAPAAVQEWARERFFSNNRKRMAMAPLPKPKPPRKPNRTKQTQSVNRFLAELQKQGGKVIKRSTKKGIITLTVFVDERETFASQAVFELNGRVTHHTLFSNGKILPGSRIGTDSRA